MPPPPEAVYLWGATYHLPDPLFSFLTAATELRRLLPWYVGEVSFLTEDAVSLVTTAVPVSLG